GWKLQSRHAAKKQDIEVCLGSDYADSPQLWVKKLDSIDHDVDLHRQTALAATQKWWREFWDRSFIFINTDNTDPKSAEWQTGRNYQLFRYMLGCNAYGSYPTKFNGGLFTYDPVFVNRS